MLTGMPLLLIAKAYLLRSVVASCVVSLLLFIPGPMAFGLKSFQPQNWLSLGLSAFILAHHILMPLYIMDDSFQALLDVPLLLLEITGVGFYIHFLSELYLQHGWNLLLDHGWQRAPSTNICIAVCCIILTFLSLEVFLRIGSLMVQHHQVLSHHSSLLDGGLQENLKPYQIIFGCSLSGAHFKGNGPTMRLSTQYYTSASQMKFVLSARKFLLRIILASCFVSLALVPLAWHLLGNADYLWLALLPCIAFHHLLSCVNVEFSYVLADLPFLVFEITSVMSYIQHIGWFNQWSPWSSIGYAFFAWVIFIGLVLEAAIWVVSLILYMAQHVPDSTNLEFMGQKIPKPHNVLLGSSLWKAHLIGETHTIRVSRGLIAIAFILVIFLNLVLNIILYPAQETGLTPTNNFRSPQVPQYLQAETPVWNVVFTTPNTHYDDGTDLYNIYWNSVFQAAVNVTPLWDNKLVVDDLKNPPCVHVPKATYFHPSKNPHIGGVQINTVYCPSRRSIPKDSQNNSSFPLAAQDSTPDLLITVNFTALHLPVGTIANLFQYSVQVMIGFTNDTQKVVDRTEATTLIPGTNTIGFITWDLRQTLKNPVLSAFGLFNSYETLVVSRMLNMFPDPLASKFSSIVYSPDIATFRVSMQNDISELKTVQDYRGQSALHGFAQVGGLWTFLSGIFAAMFGTSLVKILFGMKSVSFFGLAHSMQHKKIQAACRQEYPRAMDQICQPHSERGLISLLCDQLIDLEFLEDEKEKIDTILLQELNHVV